MPKDKYNRMDKFRLNEISFVDMPAQQPAIAAISKQGDDDDDNNSSTRRRRRRGGNNLKSADVDTEKRGDLVTLITGVTDGHQHGISISGGSCEGSEPYIYVNYASSEGGSPHDHQIYRDAQGNVTMSENEGHSHTIDPEALSNALICALTKQSNGKGTTMSTQPKTDDPNAAIEKVAELEKKLDDANAMASLNDAQKAHYKTLFDNKEFDKCKAFLAKNDAERTEEIELLKADDPTVYTADDGSVYKKSDDPRLVAMAKQADESKKDLVKAQIYAKHKEFEKVADTDLNHLPGTLEVRTALVKAISGIDDETTRTEAMSILKSQNAKMAPAFTQVGKAGVNPDAASANAELDTLAKELQKADPSLNYQDAYAKASDQNPQLLAKAIAG